MKSQISFVVFGKSVPDNFHTQRGRLIFFPQIPRANEFISVLLFFFVGNQNYELLNMNTWFSLCVFQVAIMNFCVTAAKMCRVMSLARRLK